MKFYIALECGQFYDAAILPKMTEPIVLTNCWGDCADPRASMDLIVKSKVSAPVKNWLMALQVKILNSLPSNIQSHRYDRKRLKNKLFNYWIFRMLYHLRNCDCLIAVSFLCFNIKNVKRLDNTRNIRHYQNHLFGC